MQNQYDIIIVGGGHAGCEAAHASATLGAKTLLISMNIDRFAQMSCNPAMGGVAKGQIVREIDAMGGLSGIVTDYTMIQFRMLSLERSRHVEPESTKRYGIVFTKMARIIRKYAKFGFATR